MKQQTYTIELDKMEFHAYHGCYKEERICGAHFIVSLKVELSKGMVFETDDVNDATNYLEIYEAVQSVMQESVCTLEKLSQNIHHALHKRFPQILHIWSRVKKMAPPIGGKMEGVSVTMED
ncbi:MAG: dihydroneopterin aldolase [Alistipes sp.]|nr:dihydroneopterin aldolase [Candidatus Alistipes equi]